MANENFVQFHLRRLAHAIVARERAKGALEVALASRAVLSFYRDCEQAGLAEPARKLLRAGKRADVH